MAESEGFEPSIQLPVYLLSREALSTTQPTLRVFYYTDNFIMLNDSNYRILVYDQNLKTQKIALLYKQYFRLGWLHELMNASFYFLKVTTHICVRYFLYLQYGFYPNPHMYICKVPSLGILYLDIESLRNVMTGLFNDHF